MIQASLNDDEEGPPKGKAAKKKKAKGKAKTKATKKNDELDSLDDFIVDSDDDGPKKKKAKTAKR
jgi:hypothetical protein